MSDRSVKIKEGERIVIHSDDGTYELIQYEDGLALRTMNGRRMMVRPSSSNSIYIEAII